MAQMVIIFVIFLLDKIFEKQMLLICSIEFTIMKTYLVDSYERYIYVCVKNIAAKLELDLSKNVIAWSSSKHLTWGSWRPRFEH